MKFNKKFKKFLMFKLNKKMLKFNNRFKKNKIDNKKIKKL